MDPKEKETKEEKKSQAQQTVEENLDQSFADAPADTIDGDAQVKPEEAAEASKEGESEVESAEEEEVIVEDGLRKDLETAHAELDSWKDKYLRLSAEFDNFRKRTMKEKAELILNGSEKSIIDILPVLDDLERALKTMDGTKEVDAVKDGIDLVYKKFVDILAKDGVKPIDVKDKPLDTDFHEAIAMIPAPEEEKKGIILDCVQTGYLLNGKVIRHAKVVVGQ